MTELLTIIGKCNVCGGDGVKTSTGSENGSPVVLNSVCDACGGTGVYEHSKFDVEVIMSKLDEIKTKINQMQADINYIKAKVA